MEMMTMWNIISLRLDRKMFKKMLAQICSYHNYDKTRSIKVVSIDHQNLLNSLKKYCNYNLLGFSRGNMLYYIFSVYIH